MQLADRPDWTETFAKRTVACWGEGQGTAIPTGELFEAVVLGFDHACGLRGGGTVRCWGGGTKDGCSGGDNLHCGQAIAPDREFKALGLGWLHSCGLRADGVGICWGFVPCGGVGEDPCGSQ